MSELPQVTDLSQADLKLSACRAGEGKAATAELKIC